MKVLLINPTFSIYGGIKGHGGSMVPLNLCYLAAYARTKLPQAEFKILDSEARGLSHETTADEACRFSPDVIGITANTCVFDSVARLSSLLKKMMPSVPVVLGGPHPSAIPQSALDESGADIAVIGEGEGTFAELLEMFERGRRDLSDVSGIAYREGETVALTSPRPYIKDLDTLPLPARDLVDNRIYSPPPTKRVSLSPNTLVSGSRGCTFDCGFCGAQTVWTRSIRVRSPESIVSEMEECVKRYGIGSFNFTDEFFTARKKRVLDLCGLILERGINIIWVCSARAQDMDSELLTAMKAAGCGEMSFGIESGNPEMLRRIGKSIDLDEAAFVINLARKAGIKTHASYMIGYIGETEETIKDTIKFAKRLNTDIAAFFIASPLPGTRLYKEAEEKGYLRKGTRWADYSPLSNSEPVMELPGLSPSVLKAWHRKALRGYYLRPGYIFKKILSIRRWYEVRNLIEGSFIMARIKN